MIPLKPEVEDAYRKIREGAHRDLDEVQAAVADAVILIAKDLHQALVTIATVRAREAGLK